MMRSIQLFAGLSLAIAALPMALRAQDGEPLVVTTMSFPSDATYLYAIDAIEGERAKINGDLRRALFVYSMLEEEGVPTENITVAVVVHGTATFDFLNGARYAEHYGAAENPNAALVDELLAKGGEIWMSGFGMEFRDIDNGDLLPGIGVAPAALVAHVELQRRGFGVHPK